MNGSKKWYMSKGTWGGVFTVVVAGLGMLGIVISPEIADALAGHAVEIAAIVGGLIAIWGRITAKQTIGRKSD